MLKRLPIALAQIKAGDSSAKWTVLAHLES